MDILIDTQVLVWLVDDDTRLGAEAKRALIDTSNKILISYFSFFEMTIKASIGKLSWDTSLTEDLPRMGIDLIMPDLDALISYAVFNPANKDPFDNILISVARNKKAVLMTSDPKMLTVSIPGLRVIDAKK